MGSKLSLRRKHPEVFLICKKHHVYYLFLKEYIQSIKNLKRKRCEFCKYKNIIYKECHYRGCKELAEYGFDWEENDIGYINSISCVEHIESGYYYGGVTIDKYGVIPEEHYKSCEILRKIWRLSHKKIHTFV